MIFSTIRVISMTTALKHSLCESAGQRSADDSLTLIGPSHDTEICPTEGYPGLMLPP
jgi:hypothetical protein